MNLLEVKNLKTYFYTRWGTVKAVDGISFSLNKGETMGLVGESGCGKSVTCLSILRLLPQPAGRTIDGKILFRGEDLIQKSEEEMTKIRGKEISMVLQDTMTSLNPVFSIGEQLTETIRTHHKAISQKETKELAIKMLRMVHIPSPEIRMKNHPHELSGGMRQRIVAAIALCCEPNLLIADEPTTALDATIQVQFLQLLGELQKVRNLTLLFVTHDFGLIARMCNKVAVMYAGKIVEMAEVREIFNNPTQPYTEALMQAVPKSDSLVGRLASIEGEPPNLFDIGPGCAFAPRCTYTMDKCWEQYPPVVEIKDQHWVSCWKHK